jgi:hypothetical protein
LEDVFTPEELEATARETGFCKRKSKVTPPMFFDLMMYDMSSGESKSLNQFTIEASSVHDILVTKQGIDKRFNEHTQLFLKKLIERQLSVELDLHLEAGWLSSFNRVPIKDGTRFNLPEEYMEYMPGSGGSGSRAGACIQFEFDLKSGQVASMHLTASSKPDVKDALEFLDDVKKDDLIIRDLGYYAFDSFINIIKKEAFFISRLGAKTTVFEMIGGKYNKLDFKAVYHQMKSGNISSIYKEVFIGSSVKIPVRLAIELMPDDIYEERMRRIQKHHKKKGYQTSEEYKFLSRFNLFITNVTKEVLPDNIISSLYRMRWQVELIFKIWKSVFGIHHVRKIKYQRWLCMLHFKLLMMMVNWNIIMAQRNYLYRWKGKLLSLNKCFKTLFDNTYRLRETLRLGQKGIAKFIRWTDRILNKNHWLERKKNKVGLEKIFYIMFCKSNVYVYI